MQKTSVKKEKRIIGDDVMTFLLPFPITYLWEQVFRYWQGSQSLWSWSRHAPCTQQDRTLHWIRHEGENSTSPIAWNNDYVCNKIHCFIVSGPHCHCLSASACSVSTWKKRGLLTLKTILPTYCQESTIQSLFSQVKIRCLRLGLRDVYQTQIWVALKKFGNRCAKRRGWKTKTTHVVR